MFLLNGLRFNLFEMDLCIKEFKVEAIKMYINAAKLLFQSTKPRLLWFSEKLYKCEMILSKRY